MAASRFTTFLDTFDPDPKTRGTQWEHVCKWILETDPVYRTQLKKVWLWKKCPVAGGRMPGLTSSPSATDTIPQNINWQSRVRSPVCSSNHRRRTAHRLLMLTSP